MFSKIVLIALLGVFLAGCGASALAQAPTPTNVEPTPTSADHLQVQVCADALNARLAPMGDVVTIFERGQTLKVTSPERGWSQIVAPQPYIGLWVKFSYLCTVNP